ncbi:MAG TPA: 2-dehydropantoate 2-reductase [Alphaproteobacteria bacterium]
MKLCVYGAGAIGGFLGAGLAQAGVDVSLVARGPHLAAIRERGLTVRAEGGEQTVRLPATDEPATLGTQDYVVIALKANSVPGAVDSMRPLLGPETAVVFAVNGIPWWYFYKLPGPWENRRIEAVDPGGRQWEVIGPERAIGCVVHPACEVTEPGVVQHIDGNRFDLGEPDGTASERCKALSAAMVAAGFKAPVRPRIRDDIWLKLWGNLSFNPISALTHGTLEQIARDPGTRDVARRMMLEAAAIAEKLGVRFVVSVDRRIDGAAAVGAHKTSMLQDLERGRAMEIDALLTAVAELGTLVGVPTPAIDIVLALVRLRARVAGLYPWAPAASSAEISSGKK